MTDAALAPVDNDLTIKQLIENPYPVYRELRQTRPVLKVTAAGRTFLTKADDTRYVKMNPTLFSSDDPNTPMERAFQAKTLMRRDGEDHNRLRSAMMPSMTPQAVKQTWKQRIERIADEYINRLPKGEPVDFFTAFAGPFAARCVAEVLGIPKASDIEMQRWSQALIDGAGNFAGLPEPFERAERANEEINQCIHDAVLSYQQIPASSDTAPESRNALATQLNATETIEMDHIVSNIKIAIGGGINEPRDALMTALFGLLTNPEQKQSALEQGNLWSAVFEEAVRWVAPIQLSSRRVTEDTVIRDCLIPQGDVVMTIQASANHDEDIFQDGHLFDISRDNTKRHQSFGNGPHFCMGTHLSRRMVADTVLPRLFDRFPNMILPDPERVRWSGFGFRGPLNLPLILK